MGNSRAKREGPPGEPRRCVSCAAVQVMASRDGDVGGGGGREMVGGERV